jgi:hypothetical protein
MQVTSGYVLGDLSGKAVYLYLQALVASRGFHMNGGGGGALFETIFGLKLILYPRTIFLLITEHIKRKLHSK